MLVASGTDKYLQEVGYSSLQSVILEQNMKATPYRWVPQEHDESALSVLLAQFFDEDQAARSQTR